MTRSLSLRKPPLPPMKGIHRLREAPGGGGVAEPPPIGPGGVRAGDEAICVSSASDRETGAAGGAGDGAGGRFVVGARPRRGVGGSNPPPVRGSPGRGRRPLVAPARCARRPRAARAQVGVAAGGGGRASGGFFGRVRSAAGAGLPGGGGGPK